MEELDYFPFVIVGHVDHGKSTLIGRLLFDTNSLPEGKLEEIKKTCEMLGKPFEFAYILDTLEEERKQGITIDTTQTFFKTHKRPYVIIDAPGHKEFLKNMITGSSQAEAAFLVVDVKEGISEQTRRHAFILSFLGLSQLVVVINKMDLVGWSKEAYKSLINELDNFLNKINIKPMAYIPISAMEGDNVVHKSKNMSWYNGPTVVETLDLFKRLLFNVDGSLRFPVQDVYKFDSKRVIVGKIESGKLEEGDEIIILPSKEKTRVKSIEVFRSSKEAVAGRSIGITTQDPLFIDRGNVICKSSQQLPKIVNELFVYVFWMSDQGISKGDTLYMRCSTQEVTGVLDKIFNRIDSSTLESIDDLSKIEKNNVGLIKLRLDKPLIVDDFSIVPELGRVVFENGGVISGAGIVKM